MKYCANNIHGHDHVVEWIRALDALIPVQGRNI